MNNSKRLFMDVHALQTLPPSNMNRDDTGSPKTAQYGGVRRARVSSQAWKRAIRRYFNEFGQGAAVGVRTKDIVAYVAGKMLQMDSDMPAEKAFELAEKAFNSAGVSTKDHKAKALFFLGDRQAEALAGAALAGKVEKEDREELKNILKENPEVDIALFGRMVADTPSLNEDASSQVAHAISTHAVQTEFDYYTAMDDLAPEDQAGAGMLGSIEYNSSTLYRYANVAVHELGKQLSSPEQTTAALKLFVEAFAKSMPTGKVNTFANQTLPSVLLVTLREDRPVNLVSAFEIPVKATDESGYVKRSEACLAREFQKVQKFVHAPVASFYISMNEHSELEEVGTEVENIEELLSGLQSVLEEYVLTEGE